MSKSFLESEILSALGYYFFYIESLYLNSKEKRIFYSLHGIIRRKAAEYELNFSNLSSKILDYKEDHKERGLLIYAKSAPDWVHYYIDQEYKEHGFSNPTMQKELDIRPSLPPHNKNKSIEERLNKITTIDEFGQFGI